jgi:hypothetical protein
MKQFLLALLACLAAAIHAPAQAQERIQMEGIEITGSQELPRVLYIVPWQTAERFEIDSPPIASIMERRLVPLERAAFRRKVYYHEAIFSTQKLE